MDEYTQMLEMQLKFAEEEAQERERLAYEQGREDGYNNGLDDLISKINEHKTKGYVTGITYNLFELGACQMANDIVKIVEQLKGGKNE